MLNFFFFSFRDPEILVQRVCSPDFKLCFYINGYRKFIGAASECTDLLLKNVQMGEMGVWRRCTDGGVFSF